MTIFQGCLLRRGKYDAAFGGCGYGWAQQNKILFSILQTILEFFFAGWTTTGWFCGSFASGTVRS